VRLRPLRVDDEEQARAAHLELAEDDFPFLLDWHEDEPWTAYVRRVRNQRCGIDLPPGWVPSTFLVAEADGELLGRVSIRHEFNDFLENFGGHIGYAVRPAHRRRGFATEILRQALIIARAEGIVDVLVTCDEGNFGSIAVIERVGGTLEDVRVEPGRGPKRRYWIR
jgi:predicted acetyltransferase